MGEDDNLIKGNYTPLELKCAACIGKQVQSTFLLGCTNTLPTGGKGDFSVSSEFPEIIESMKHVQV